MADAQQTIAARGGHTDATFLGALKVDEKGNVANWTVPARCWPAWAAPWIWWPAPRNAT